MPKVPDYSFPNRAVPETKKVRDDFLLIAVDNKRKRSFAANMANKRKAKQ